MSLNDLLFAVFTRIFEPGPERPHHSGDFGDTTSTLKPYGELTTAEHDKIGEFWAVDLRDVDGASESVEVKS